MTLADVPIQVFCSLIYLMITYYMTSQPWQFYRFGLFVAICLMVVFVAQALGLFVGALFSVKVRDNKKKQGSLSCYKTINHNFFFAVRCNIWTILYLSIFIIFWIFCTNCRCTSNHALALPFIISQVCIRRCNIINFWIWQTKNEM